MLTSCTVVVAIAAVSPVDVEARAPSYDQAVLARQTGHPNEAVRLLERWLSEQPDDLDAHLQYGYALLDLGRLGEAEGAFSHVLQRAPAYADARIGLAYVARRRGQVSQARAWLRPILDNNAEARLLLTQLRDPAADRWQLDAAASRSSVNRGQPDWRELAGQLRFQPSRATSLTARVEATRRFGLRDVYGEAQVARRFSPAWSAYLLTGGTAGADYRPSWQLGGGLSVKARAGANPTIVTFDLRHAGYRSGAITTLQPSVEQYVLGGKAWVTGRVTTLVEDGRPHAGVLGRVDVQASPKLRLFAGAANTPDTSEGVVSRAMSRFGGLEATLGMRQSLRLSLARINQKAGADRVEVSASIATRF